MEQSFGLADPEALDGTCRWALELAADTLEVDLARDACRLKSAEVLEGDSSMASLLPSKHRLRYTRPFAFRFLGALHSVVDRLADRSNDDPVCRTVAQELALRALVVTAVGLVDDDHAHHLWAFRDLWVRDTDVDLLFDEALDGVEDPEAPGDFAAVAPANLAWDHWFVPFGGAWPPAPTP